MPQGNRWARNGVNYVAHPGSTYVALLAPMNAGQTVAGRWFIGKLKAVTCTSGDETLFVNMVVAWMSRRSASTTSSTS
jgi:hypothetical protein